MSLKARKGLWHEVEDYWYYSKYAKDSAVDRSSENTVENKSNFENISVFYSFDRF